MTGKTLLRLWFLATFCLGLAAIIATNILSFERVAPGFTDQVDARLHSVITASGGVVVPTSGKKLPILERVIQFKMPDCAVPFIVLPERLGISAEAKLRLVTENSTEEYGIYTAYLDKTVAGYGFAGFQLQSLQLQIGQVFGVQRYNFVIESLTVLVPKSCPNVKPPQWTQFWTSEATL